MLPMLRPFRRGDLPALVKIEVDLVGDYPWSDCDFMAASLCDFGDLVIAEYKGAVIGYAAYQYEAKTMCVMNLGVSRPYQRQGVGTALLNMLVRWCQAPNERRTLLVAVREKNVEAQKFLRAFGARCFAIHESFRWATGGEDNCYLFEYPARPSFLRNRISDQLLLTYQPIPDDEAAND